MIGDHLDQLAQWAKALLIPAAVSFGVVVAQLEIPDIVAWPTGLGFIAALALLIARYTFSQLEQYRTDVKLLQQRIDELQERLSTAEATLRRLDDYALMLRRQMSSAGLDPPPYPEW